MFDTWKDIKEFSLFILTFFGAVCIVAFGIVGISNQINFPAQLRRVEVVRSSLPTVAPGDRGELISRAVRWNERIVNCQYWNSRWWSDVFYPDGCNGVDLIDVSGKEK